MFEHELLMLAAAPLLVLARPVPTALWAFSTTARQTLGRIATSGLITRLWRGMTSPVIATLLQAAVLWVWHAPALFDRALASEAWHAAQHASFLIGGLLFWKAILARGTARGAAVLCLFATSLVSGALGALMAFAASPWYARYAELGLAPFGLTPSEDQQLAGLLMWIPGGMVHALAALMLVHGMLRQERRGVHAG
jgi:cytochrome c oxidase assembly factor CtaG